MIMWSGKGIQFDVIHSCLQSRRELIHPVTCSATKIYSPHLLSSLFHIYNSLMPKRAYFQKLVRSPKHAMVPWGVVSAKKGEVCVWFGLRFHIIIVFYIVYIVASLFCNMKYVLFESSPSF